MNYNQSVLQSDAERLQKQQPLQRTEEFSKFETLEINWRLAIRVSLNDWDSLELDRKSGKDH